MAAALAVVWLVGSLVPFSASLLEAGVVVGEVEQLVEQLVVQLVVGEVEQLVVLLVGQWTGGVSARLR